MTRPPDRNGFRYCGNHNVLHSLEEFTGYETICRRAKYILHVKRKYGLSVEEYEALVGDGICPICRVREHKYVDHEHATGRVRGLLCPPCNSALGAFEEDPMIFHRALRYLREAPEPGPNAGAAALRAVS